MSKLEELLKQQAQHQFQRNLQIHRHFLNLQEKFSDNSHPKTFDWNWSATNYNRIALVNMLVSLRGGIDCKYLEIGCESNALFDSVFSNKKVGVDPATGGTNRETSDEFFSSNYEKFDVIFIDGLHEYEQVRRDAINALKSLNESGWIAFHDLLPRNWKEHHVPRLQHAWTGDCWKLAFELAKSDDVDFQILNIDHGVGVLRAKKKDAGVIDMSSDLSEEGYGYFVDNLDVLPRVDWFEGVDWILSYHR